MSNETRDEIKSYITRSNWKIVDIVERLKDYGIHTTPQALSNKLSRDTIRYSEVKAIAEIIGYKLTWEKIPVSESGLTSDISKVKIMPNMPGKGGLFNGSGILSDGIKNEFVETYKKQLQEDLFNAFIENYVIPENEKK